MDTYLDLEIHFKQDDFEFSILTSELTLLESMLPELVSSMIQNEVDDE